MRILIVEDEKRLAQALKQILEEKKYMTDVVNNGVDGLEYGLSGIYDVIVLDIMLPGKNGYEVAGILRKNNIKTPLIMLTAKDAVEDKVRGLDSGADDYMTKPFSPEELLARVRALSRRNAGYTSDEMQIGDISFDAATSVLKCNGKEIRLNFKESEILKLLFSHNGGIVSKEDIITKVWGYESDASDSNVEAYISFIRKKLSFVGAETIIVSIKKQGYRLEVSEK